MDTLHHALAQIRAKATELRDSFADEARARALEWAASLMECAIREGADERLSLSEAALRSGYSAEHLARLIREGRLPNAGRRGSPRLRAGDLSVRLHRAVASARPRAYDPLADARAIAGRR
ncbi:MAG TPA: hypothetical protein VKA84_27165 [Gemmatimonadaceae bacterium]|nr:hypothetical protein [Gemmatimonadaceae bacterium]